MVTIKEYVIITIVYILVAVTIACLVIGYSRPKENEIDILEETEIIETAVEVVPESSIKIEPTIETLNYVEFIEPTEAPTEHIHETEPITEPTEPVTEPETEPTIEPTEPPTEEEEQTEESYDPVELLACVIYQEAGSDSICDDCRYRVADVVLNRVTDSRFPDTIHGVLTAPGQYGNYSKTGVVWPKRANNSGEKHAVQRAYNIAMSVVAGTHSELYGEGYVWQAQFVQGKDNIYCCNHYYGR